MVDRILDRARQLKEALTDFVYDSEGDLATALETFSACQLRKAPQQSLNQRNLLIDLFISEGMVGEQSPITLFLESEKDLSDSDRLLVKGWAKSFVGIFEIKDIRADGFELMNWTTALNYVVKPNNVQTAQTMTRYKVGEILVTQIAPVSDEFWMFSSPCITLGKLGKPKLAVAINNFKQNYPNHLYSDAPELLAESWLSVEKYHQEFVDFFAKDEITLSGYELGKKLAEFQQVITQKQLEASGIDKGKSLDELARQAGVSEEELESLAREMGADEKTAKELLQNKEKTKMVLPQVDLPPQLKKSEQVTALSHPRWGQYFLPTYEEFRKILHSDDWQNNSRVKALVNNYLTSQEVSFFIWQRLAQEAPGALEAILRSILNRVDFNLERDLALLMEEHNKPIEPVLPEIASVPLHLHNLFQDAILQVKKSQPKNKKLPKHI